MTNILRMKRTNHGVLLNDQSIPDGSTQIYLNF